MKKFFSKKYLVLLIFSFALATRLYHLPTRAIFTADEEYQATYANTIVEDFHPVWIGVSAADTGFYLGPYFTYFTSLCLYLSNGDPLITNYVSSILGAVTAVLLYFLGKAVSTQKVALSASLLYSFSPLVVYLDARYWNPSPSAFIAVLLLLACAQLKSQKWWLPIIAFCLGAIWHVHLSLVPLYLVGLYAIWQNLQSISIKVWTISLLIFLVMITPLLIFDFNHDFSNISTPLRMIQDGGKTLDLKHNVLSLGATLARLLYLSPGTIPSAEIRPGCTGSDFTTPALLATILALIPLLFIGGNRYLKLALVAMTGSYLLYPGETTGYYLLGLFPFYFLVLAKLIHRFKYGFILLFVFIVLSLVTISQTSEDYGVAHKEALIAQVMDRVGEESFSLEEAGTCHKYGGWRYLFSVYGKTPSSSSTDSSLSWLYPHQVLRSGTYLVQVGATTELERIGSPLAVYESGGYTAVITYYEK